MYLLSCIVLYIYCKGILRGGLPQIEKICQRGPRANKCVPDQFSPTIFKMGDIQAIEALTGIVNRLTLIEEARSSGVQRPKAISCRVYNLKDDWPSFSLHFTECVKAAYSYTLPRDQERLHAACLNWLPSKLEPGATHSAYDNLDAATKESWPDVCEALKEAFSDDAEREAFINNVAHFKRGNKPLVEYKNELIKKMNANFDTLKRVPAEFQRQPTTRFIEGLEDEKLKAKL